MSFAFQSGSAGQQAAKELSERLTVRMLNIPSYTRWFVRFAGISGASAVALGAYGAHGMYLSIVVYRA